MGTNLLFSLLEDYSANLANFELQLRNVHPHTYQTIFKQAIKQLTVTLQEFKTIQCYY